MGRGVGRATTLVSVVLAGCGSSLPPPPPSAAALVLVPSGATIARGDRLTLKAYLRRPDGSLREVTSGVQWRSTRPRIAAVGDGGLAVARRSGSARIRASVDGHRAVARATVVHAPRALKVSPANPRYFEDAAGRMVYLAGAHTWSDLLDSGRSDPPPRFDYDRYLDLLQAHNLNLTRLWAWEQASWTAEIEGDYRFAPTMYVRTGPDVGLDGKPQFDLTKLNEAYFARLRRRVQEAGRRGVYAIVMLFDGWSVEPKGPGLNNPWRGHPLNVHNNVNGIDGDPDGTGNGRATHTLANPVVTRLQVAYVRRVVDAVADQPNVLFEISNESSSGSVDWQAQMAGAVAERERGRALRHPIGISAEWPEGSNRDLLASDADWIAPNGPIDDPPTSDGRKVIVADTDHLCGVCGDAMFPWKSLTRGLNPLFMDIYDGRAVGLGAQDGNPRDPAWEQLRRALGATRVVADRLDLARMRPSRNLASSGYCLADPRAAGTYLVYVPDGSSVTVDLSSTPGTLRAAWVLPQTGEVTRSQTVTGGSERKLSLPFSAPAVLLLRSSAET